MSRRARSRLLIIASLAAPVLAAQGMRFLGAGPARSVGSVVTPAGAIDPGAAPSGLPEPTEKQTRAMQWLRLRATDRPIRCPMQQPDRPPTPPDPVVTTTIDPVVPSGPDPLAALTVTSIMAGEDGGLATINGKVYALGASPLSGWTITLIAPDQWLVQLAGPEGREVSLYLKKPDTSR